MKLGLLATHSDALAVADPKVKQFVAAPFDTQSLATFKSEWGGQLFDLYAFCPVIDAIKEFLDNLMLKHDLNGSDSFGFLMSPEDALGASQCFDFLSFLFENCVNSSVRDQFMFYLETKPHKFALAANPNVVIAASTFAVKFDDDSIYDKKLRYQDTFKVISRDDFIPIYDSERGSSDYLNYLTSIPDSETIKPFTVDNFTPSLDELSDLSGLELIAKGMSLTSREFWSDLIFECRKLEASKANNLPSRIELVKLHVAISLFADKQDTSEHCSSLLRYPDIFDPQLLDQFPELIDTAIPTLQRSLPIDDPKLQKVTLFSQIQSNDIFLFSLEKPYTPLVYAIAKFYKTCPKYICSPSEVLSPTCTILAMLQLQKFNAEHRDLVLQEAICFSLLLLIKAGNKLTAIDGSNTTLIHDFVLMLARQVTYDSFQDNQVAKALLKIITLLITTESAITLASDTLTLKTLAEAMKWESCQALAIHALTNILDADLLCYSYVGDLWTKFVSISDRLALATLYTFLVKSDYGKKIIETYSLTPKLLDSAFQYNVGGYYYSELYYNHITGSITAEPEILELFANRVIEYTDATLRALDESIDEHSFNIYGRLFYRRSKNEKVVNHYIWLMSCLVHRESIREKLATKVYLEKLIRILSHPHLPYGLASTVNSNTFLRTLVTEIAISKNFQFVLVELLQLLEKLLVSNNLRAANVAITCLSALPFEDSEEVVPVLFKDQSFKHICSLLPESMLKLCYTEADYLSGNDAPIVECFWPGVRDIIGGHRQFIDRSNTPRWQRIENFAFQKLGRPQNEFDNVHADAMLTRYLKENMSTFLHYVGDFLDGTTQWEMEGGREAYFHLMSSYVSSLNSIPMQNARDRYSFVTFLECRLPQAIAFLHCGGLQCIVEQHVKLCSSPPDGGDLIKRYIFSRSDFKNDCIKAIESQLSYITNKRSPYHTLDHLGCQPTAMSSLFESIRYLLQEMAESHTPFIPEFNDMLLLEEKGYDIEAFLDVQEFALNNYRKILKNQSFVLMLESAKFLATIFARFEARKPLISTLVPRLTAECGDAASLALLGALMDRKISITYSLAGIVPQLDSNDSALVMSAAQVLRHSPQVLENFDLCAVLMKQTEPRVLLMVLELLTSSLLHGVVQSLDTNIEAMVTYCYSVFEKNDFDFASSLCLVSLSDAINCYLQNDPAILEMTMAHLLALKGGKNKSQKIVSVEVDCPDLAGRSLEALQSTLEQYFVLDHEGSEVYMSRFISAFHSEIPVAATKELMPETTSVIDMTIENYAKGAQEFLGGSIAVVSAKNALGTYRNKTASIDEIAWESVELTQLARSYRSSWNKFRKVYLKMRLYADILTRITFEPSSATDYIVNSSQLKTLVASCVKYASGMAIQKNSTGCWENYINAEIKHDLVFWPVVNILGGEGECSNEHAINMVFQCFEQILENNEDGRSATAGILYILQIRGLQTIDLVTKLNKTRILELCEKHLDFKNNTHNIFDTEDLFFKLTDKLNNQFANAERRCEEIGAKCMPLDNDDNDDEEDEEDEKGKESESAQLASVEAPSGLTIDTPSPIQLDETDYDEEEGESNDDELTTDLDEDTEYYDSDDEWEYSNGMWPYEIIGGPFEDDDQRDTFIPNNRILYQIWDIDPPSSINERKTLETIVPFEKDDEVAPIYFWRLDDSERELLLRGMDSKPGIEPTDSSYFTHVKCPLSPLHDYAWSSYSLQVNLIFDDSLTTHSQITRPWQILKSGQANIDWSQLRQLDRAQLDLPLPEDDTIRNHAAQDVAPELMVQDFSAQDLAIQRACDLLDNPEQLATWGIDASELDCYPEDLRLEVLISLVVEKSGEEMEPRDILATFEESLLLDTCDASNLAGDNSVPGYMKIASKAQITGGVSISEALRRIYYEKQQPSRLKWPKSLYLQFSFYLGQGDARYPNNCTNKALNQALLTFTLENFDNLSSRSHSKVLEFLSRRPSGSLYTIQLLEIIDSPTVLRDPATISALCETVKAHVDTSPDGKLLKSQTIRKILAAFYFRSLRPASRKKVKELIKTLVAKKYLSKPAFRAHVYADILEQLDNCMSIKSGFIDARAFSDLEATLSILSSYKICDLNKNNEALVEKAMELGSQVSKNVSEKDPSSIKLLKCYLLLVGMASNARPAFVKFVTDNRTLVNRISLKDKSLLKSCANNLQGHYDLLDFDVKVELVRSFAPAHTNDGDQMVVHRENIVEDTLAKLQGRDFKLAFNIKFDDELGIDEGGLTREWLTLFGRSLADSNTGLVLFKKIHSGNHYTLYPNPQSLHDPLSLGLYKVLGKLMAKTVLAQHSLNCQLSSIVYKAIVADVGDVNLTVDEDVEAFDGELASSLRWMAENDITDVIMETFTSNSAIFSDAAGPVELKPGGNDIQVTESNKLEYIHLTTQYIYKGVENQLEAISNGFRSILPWSLTRVFTAAELQRMLCGTHEINVTEWKANTTYTLYTSESTPVQIFWQVVEAMSNDERRSLLMFVTGSDRVSSQGFSMYSTGTKFAISRQDQADKMPTASTCLSTLMLPPYSTYEKARIDITKAIELGCEGFGMG